MSSVVAPNAQLYQLQAQQLTQASSPSKAARLYQDAVQQILQNRSGNGIKDDQVRLITSQTDIDTLLDEVKKAKAQNGGSSNGGVRMFQKAAKASLETLERFEKAVDVMVQSSMVSKQYAFRLLSKSSSDPTIASLVWGSLRFLLIVSKRSSSSDILR